MAASSSWEFHKEDQTRILWVHIWAKNFTGVAIQINKWLETRYPEYKLRVVSKKEFEQLKFKTSNKIYLW